MPTVVPISDRVAPFRRFSFVKYQQNQGQVRYWFTIDPRQKITGICRACLRRDLLDVNRPANTTAQKKAESDLWHQRAGVRPMCISQSFEVNGRETLFRYQNHDISSSYS